MRAPACSERGLIEHSNVYGRLRHKVSARLRINTDVKTNLIAPAVYFTCGIINWPSSSTALVTSKVDKMEAMFKNMEPMARCRPGHIRLPKPKADSGDRTLGFNLPSLIQRSGMNSSGFGYSFSSCNEALNRFVSWKIDVRLWLTKCFRARLRLLAGDIHCRYRRPSDGVEHQRGSLGSIS